MQVIYFWDKRKMRGGRFPPHLALNASLNFICKKCASLPAPWKLLQVEGSCCSTKPLFYKLGWVLVHWLGLEGWSRLQVKVQSRAANLVWSFVLAAGGRWDLVLWIGRQKYKWKLGWTSLWWGEVRNCEQIQKEVMGWEPAQDLESTETYGGTVMCGLPSGCAWKVMSIGNLRAVPGNLQQLPALQPWVELCQLLSFGESAQLILDGSERPLVWHKKDKKSVWSYSGHVTTSL